MPDAAKVKTLKDFRDLAEKEFILAKLEANNWNISQTARDIDTPRSNLYKKLEQYGIKITTGVGEAGAVPAPEDKRGITKNNFYSLYDIAMLGIINLSKVPLRLVTALGFASACVSFLAGLGIFVLQADLLVAV